MRLFELVLLIIIAVSPFLLSGKLLRSNKLISFLVLGGILLLHYILEGYRWQMIPAYLLLLIIVGCIIANKSFFTGAWWKKLLIGLPFLLSLLIAWALPNLLPVFDLPSPTGEHSIGSKYFHLKTDQDEIITDAQGDKRELMVKVWYPAQSSNRKTEPYLNDGDRIGFANKYGLPASIFNYLDRIETNTYENPEIADGKFPVLIFSHGSYSKASGYYALLEEITSHGYIILNINHTYESVGTLFPNGEIKYYNTAFDQKHNNQQMAEMVWNGMQNYKEATTDIDQFDAIQNLIRNYFAADVTMRWSKDVSLVIDELNTWNAAGFLAGHLDVSKLGVFGHSQGGAAAGQALFDDQRIKAGINIDGVQWGPMIDNQLTKPFALVSSDWPPEHPDFNKHIFRKGSSADFYQSKILNSGHSNFMDIPLMIKIPMLNEADSIDPLKAYKLTSAITVQFFDKYLKEKNIDLKELDKLDKELEFRLIEIAN